MKARGYYEGMCKFVGIFFQIKIKIKNILNRKIILNIIKKNRCKKLWEFYV